VRPDTDFEHFVKALEVRHARLAPAMLHRMARAYGSRIERVLADDLGAEVAPGLHEGELRYLRDQEWATCAEDVLWRRSKLGLHMDESQRRRVADWLGAREPAEASCN